MAEASKPLEWLPGFLIVLGLLSLAAGWYEGGTEMVGGIVFGVLSLAAAGAILYRRARDEREAKSKGDTGSTR